jgi:hypothetical protein
MIIRARMIWGFNAPPRSFRGFNAPSAPTHAPFLAPSGDSAITARSHRTDGPDAHRLPRVALPFLPPPMPYAMTYTTECWISAPSNDSGPLPTVVAWAPPPPPSQLGSGLSAMDQVQRKNWNAAMLGLPNMKIAWTLGLPIEVWLASRLASTVHLDLGDEEIDHLAISVMEVKRAAEPSQSTRQDHWPWERTERRIDDMTRSRQQRLQFFCDFSH